MRTAPLSVGDKILLAMYELSRGSTKPLKYEDIVIAAWKKYPQDFSLRGYDYPDSSDIHKPLYGPLKTRGLVRTANKFFALTEHGQAYIGKLIDAQKGKSPNGRTERLARDEQVEINRLLQSDAFRLYEKGEKEKILDSDVYTFYGVTVRTNENEFRGRIYTVEAAIEKGYRLLPDNTQIRLLRGLRKYLTETERFKEVIPKK